MRSVGVREFKRDTSRILRRVREDGEPFNVTYRGKEFARLVPVSRLAPTVEPESEPLSIEAFFAEWDALAKEIGEHWPEGYSAVDAVREQRREL